MLALSFILSAVSLLSIANCAALSKNCGKCDVSKAKLQLPSTAAAAGLTIIGKPVFVTIGAGKQLYNCKNGTWASNGAIANLYDVSCLATQPALLKTIAKGALSLAKVSPSAFSKTIQALAKSPIKQVGEHFFVPTAGTTTGAISPEFNFDSAHGGPMPVGAASTFIGAKAGALNSPDGVNNVQWLKLNSTSGTLATNVFRVFTVAGQPSTTTCTGSATTESSYVAQYWFFK